MTWQRSTLGELVEEGVAAFQTGPFGTVLAASEYVESGVPMVSVGEIRPGRIVAKSTTPRISEATSQRLPRYLLAPGDIVFARKGSVERSAWITSNESGWFLGSDAIRLRLTNDVDSRFVALQLQLEDRQDFLVQHAGGSTLPSMNEKILARVPFARPPLREQQAIAGVLGALDDKIAANGRLADLHNEVAATAYAATARGLSRVRMSERLTPILGGTPDRARTDYWGGKAPWLSVKDVVNAAAGVVIDTTEHITEEAIAKTKAKPLEAGSVVLTARGTVGEVARLGTPASFNQSCYGFAPGALPESVLYFAVRGAVEQIRQLVHGSVFDTITKQTFEHIDIPHFSDPVAGILEERIRPHLAAVESVARESRDLAKLRDALLPELMSGRLRVRDAERAVEEVL